MHHIPLWKAQLIIAATEDGKKKNHSNSVWVTNKIQIYLPSSHRKINEKYIQFR
jgi:hypothetical protein